MEALGILGFVVASCVCIVGIAISGRCKHPPHRRTGSLRFNKNITGLGSRVKLCLKLPQSPGTQNPNPKP